MNSSSPEHAPSSRGCAVSEVPRYEAAFVLRCSIRHVLSCPSVSYAQVFGTRQGARPGLGESLADRGGDSAVAEPSHVRRLACEHAGLSGRGRSRVTCNGGGPISDRGPPVSAHVTRNGGAPERRHLATQVGLEASALSIEQARFPVLFARNVEPRCVGFENRRDLRCFLEGGRQRWMTANSWNQRLFGYGPNAMREFCGSPKASLR